MTKKFMPGLFWVLVLTCINTPDFLLAQNAAGKNDFDSTYYYIATTLSAQDINQAVSAAESLLNASADSLQKVRSLMLLATLHERTGRHTEGLNFAVEGERIAEKIGNKEWQARISGFLSTTFRDLGLIAEGKKYIEVAEKANNGVTGSPLIKLFIHQEKAYYEIEAKNYDRALAEVRQAMDLVEKAPPNKRNTVVFATCYQLAGFCYMNLDSIHQATGYLTKSLEILGDQESELKGFIYQNLGELALKQKNYADAIKYLDIALNYTTSSDNFNLKGYTYKSLHHYYLSQGDSTNAMSFQAKYTELIEIHSSLTRDVSNGLIKKFDYELGRKTTKNYILYAICGALLFAITFFMIHFTRSRKKERAKYLEYIAKLNIQKLVTPADPTPTDGNEEVVLADNYKDLEAEEVYSTSFIEQKDDPAGFLSVNTQLSPENDKKEGFYIPRDTEERVLRNLSKLEQEKFYLRNDMNLSYLSVTLKINSKYLSLIINKHKGKDFSNYINESRINYIIEKLQNNPEYLEYKIAYLARECGFSTHSKFTAAFRHITGIAPSAFISNLKKDAR